MSQTEDTQKKAAPTEAAKTQPKPKPTVETYESTPSVASVPFLPNKAWLILLPIAAVGLITSVSLVFTGSSNSHQQEELHQLQTKFDGYQSGVKDSRN